MNSPHPHVNFEIEDIRRPEAVVDMTLPRFRPLVITRGEKGADGVPVWAPNYTAARRFLGEKTFDRTSDQWTRESEYLRRILQGSGAFIVRLTDRDAKAAAIAIEAHLTPNATLEVYERDANGARTLDANGDYVVLDGETVDGYEIVWTARGLNAEETPESFLESDPATDGDATSYPMAVAVADSVGAWGNTSGLALFYSADANENQSVERNGTVFFSMAPIQQPDSVVESIPDLYGSTQTSFAVKPDVVDPDTNTALSAEAVLRETYDNNRLPFDLKFAAANWKTVGDLVLAKESVGVDAMPWQFEDGAATYTASWTDGSTDMTFTAGSLPAEGDIVEGMAVAAPGIPYGTVVESVSITTGEIDAITLSKEAYGTSSETEVTIDDPLNPLNELEGDNENFDGWSINILTGRNPLQNGNHYETLVVKTNSDYALLSTLGSDYTLINGSLKSSTFMLENGTDGDFNDIDFEASLRSFLAMTYENSEEEVTDLRDHRRYPFNYIFDTGYTRSTKEALIDFLGTRRDVSASIGSYVPTLADDGVNYDWSRKMSPIEIVSSGASLRDYCLLNQESYVKGTHACRATVWGPSGRVSDLNTRDWFPMTIWDAQVHARHHGSETISTTPEGRPYTEVDMFDEFDYIPTNEDLRARMWSDGVNYVQSYSMTGYFVAFIRSVYDYENSGLVSREFVDELVYVKQAVDVVWTRYTGKNISFADLRSQATPDISAAVDGVFNGRYPFETVLYQTAVQEQQGYRISVDVRIQPPDNIRVWDVNLISDSTFEPEEA